MCIEEDSEPTVVLINCYFKSNEKKGLGNGDRFTKIIGCFANGCDASRVEQGIIGYIRCRQRP